MALAESAGAEPAAHLQPATANAKAYLDHCLKVALPLPPRPATVGKLAAAPPASKTWWSFWKG